MLVRMDVIVYACARDEWGEFEGVPEDPESLARELLALPESELIITKDIRAPAVFYTVEGEIRGKRYRIVGPRAGNKQYVTEVHPC